MCVNDVNDDMRETVNVCHVDCRNAVHSIVTVFESYTFLSVYSFAAVLCMANTRIIFYQLLKSANRMKNVRKTTDLMCVNWYLCNVDLSDVATIFCTVSHTFIKSGFFFTKKNNETKSVLVSSI